MVQTATQLFFLVFHTAILMIRHRFGPYGNRDDCFHQFSNSIEKNSWNIAEAHDHLSEAILTIMFSFVSSTTT
jgi:hypothetical protein